MRGLIVSRNHSAKMGLQCLHRHSILPETILATVGSYLSSIENQLACGRSKRTSLEIFRNGLLFNFEGETHKMYFLHYKDRSNWCFFYFGKRCDDYDPVIGEPIIGDAYLFPQRKGLGIDVNFRLLRDSFQYVDKYLPNRISKSELWAEIRTTEINASIGKIQYYTLHFLEPDASFVYMNSRCSAPKYF